MEPTGNHQDSRPELVESHEHLLSRLSLSHDAHLIFYCQHLGDPRAEDSLIVGQNQFQHLFTVPQIRNCERTRKNR